MMNLQREAQLLRVNQRLMKYLVAVLHENKGQAEISLPTQLLVDSLTVEGLEEIQIKMYNNGEDCRLTFDPGQAAIYKASADPGKKTPRAFYTDKAHVSEINMAELDGIVKEHAPGRVFHEGDESWKTGLELLDRYVLARERLDDEYEELFLESAKREGGTRRLAKKALHTLAAEVAGGDDAVRGHALRIPEYAERRIQREITELTEKILNEPLEDN